MKNLLVVFTVLGLILAMTPATKAAVLTFEFDPNDLLDLYNTDFTGLKANQANARRVHEVWANTWYQTFADHIDPTTTQPGSGNTYLNWRNGLGENEGIGSFSTWLHGDPGARAWGEILLADPSQPMSATAASGWNATIVANPYDTGFGAGYVAVWWTTDPAKYIRPGGADIGTFSFTADLYEDLDENNNIAGDPDATLGVPYRIWFADTWMNEGDSSLPALVFDNTWGSSPLTPNYGTFAQTVGGDSGVEAILTLAAIPEPASILVWSVLSLICVGAYRWRRRSGVVAFGGARQSKQPARQPWPEGTTDAILEIIERGRMI